MAGLKDDVFGCWLGPQGFLHRREDEGRNARPASFFDWGFWGMLTKNVILYHDLQNYYFFNCYAYENIEKIFMIIHFLQKKYPPEKNKLLN